MAEKVPGGVVYKGPCGLLKDSAWITAESLPTDRDVPVQIEAVLRRNVVEFNRGGKTEKKNSYGSLKFVGKEKELGLNSTNLRILSALFGSDTSRWFGQWVTLYVDPNVNAFGHIVSAVRLRAKPTTPPVKGTPVEREPGEEA